jgi:hypothetical protein
VTIAFELPAARNSAATAKEVLPTCFTQTEISN